PSCGGCRSTGVEFPRLCWVRSRRKWATGTLRVGKLQCHSRSARVFAEHDPPPTAWRGECPQRSFGPNLDLPCASRAAELLDAIGVHGRPRPPVPQIAAARAERVRTFNPDIVRVERERIAAFDTVPLEGLQEELRHGCIAVVRIEDVHVLGPKPGTLVHSSG